MSSLAPACADTLPSSSHHVFDGATRLSDWGVIRARGEDAASFLQGQLTNDVVRLAGQDSGRARLAGYCSPKGRLLASFVVWQSAADEWLLACSADVLPATLKRLSMFVLRAKCKLSDASAELALWGLGGAAGQAWLGDAMPAMAWDVTRAAEAQVVRLPDALGHARCLWVATTGQAPVGLPELPAAAWRWLEVHSGVVRVVAATAEHFVPQMVNFELVGGVDFKKGCYPGQEVVARSQYRGTLKRRGVLLASPVAMTEGQEVFHDGDPGQPAGTVALAASLGGVGGRPEAADAAAGGSGDLHVALVELKYATLASGQLHLAAADGPVLSPRTLPYALPQDNA